VAVAGSYAYVADYNCGLRVIDVSNPESPQEVGYYDTPGDAWRVSVMGRLVYVADGDHGLQVIEFYGAGVEETPNAEVRTTNAATIVRGVLRLPESRGESREARS
jgi:hypothetical protein